MKSNKDIFRKLRYGDFIVVGTALAVSVVLFVLSFSGGERLTATVSLDGEIVRQVELYELDSSEIISVGGCEILLEKDGVTFLSSECPDKLCVKRGRLERAGDTMACLPERVAVVLKAEKGNTADAVAY